MKFQKGHNINLGKKRTEEWKETRKGICLNSGKTHFKKGHIPWSKSKKGIHLSPESEFKKGESSPLKGKKNPNGSIAKTGKNNPMYGKRGILNPQFKGNSRERVRLMQQSEYKQWRSDVFIRDNWTCQTCGARGVKLNAHHIKKWSQYKQLRYDVNNGVTLCESCHKLTHSKKYENLPTRKD